VNGGGVTPRRRVYLVRRGLVLLGVLILLVLLVPQAYQALVSSGDESNPQPSGAAGGDGEQAAQNNPSAEPPTANSGATGDEGRGACRQA
jgi:hypothetical protein